MLYNPAHLWYIYAMGSVLAVASGKGGVGKTTVALNLALQWAKKGLQVLIVDADPLSDIASALDITDEDLRKVSQKIELNKPLSAYRLSLFSGVSVLFPHPATDKTRNKKLKKYLEKRGVEEAKRNSDILLLDLPAGVDEEENLTFLPFADSLLLVTNPDPLSHAAAGSYLFQMARDQKDWDQMDRKGSNLPVLFWHNRYKGVQLPGFDPQDIIGNYNRNVTEERQLDQNSLNTRNISYLPPDPALDLLAGEARLKPLLLRSMTSSTELILDTYLQSSYPLDFLGKKSAKLLYAFLRKGPTVDNPDTMKESEKELINSFLDYMALCAGEKGSGLPALTDEEKKHFLKLFGSLGKDRFYLQCRWTESVLEGAAEDEVRKTVDFAQSGGGKESYRGLDREIVSLLMRCNEAVSSYSELRNPGGLLFFQYGLMKLFDSSSVRKVVEDAIPRNSDGSRDRKTQIALLIKKSDSYHGKYLSLVKKLFPLAIKQINTMAETLEIHALLLRDKAGAVSSTAYASLSSAFLHEAVHSGLGIIIGFKHRPAAEALRKGSEGLLQFLTEQAGGENGS
jgi:MinD-like ATPase involved in chromosome partitioning or flagellar assembly